MPESPKTQLLHFSEGRVRLKSRALRGDRTLARRIESTLSGTIGIRSAKVNPITATLLVQYDDSAWRDPAGTRKLYDVLSGLFPGEFARTSVAIPIAEFSAYPAVRDAALAAFETAKGVTRAGYDSGSETVRVEFDPEQFALRPVLQDLHNRWRGHTSSREEY